MIDEQVEKFFYWIEERHKIFWKKEIQKSPYPWTEDKILKEYKFTNPFRENDRTTIWFRKNIRDPLRNNPSVLMATVIFRWFNLIQTGENLLRFDLLEDWDPQIAYNVIKDQDKWITGAYMIKSPTGLDKIAGINQCINNLWKDRKELIEKVEKADNLHDMWFRLTGYSHLGGFLSYEVITDLRHTYLGWNAKDIDTWANAGPGAMRGLNRIWGRPLTYRPKKQPWTYEMVQLLKLAKERYKESTDKALTKMELRDIEHSLCEFDKYERVRLGQGTPRSKYERKA